MPGAERTGARLGRPLIKINTWNQGYFVSGEKRDLVPHYYVAQTYSLVS